MFVYTYTCPQFLFRLNVQDVFIILRKINYKLKIKFLRSEIYDLTKMLNDYPGLFVNLFFDKIHNTFNRNQTNNLSTIRPTLKAKEKHT